MNHITSSTSLPTSSSRASGSGTSIPSTPKNHRGATGGGQQRSTPSGRHRKAQSSSPQALNPFASSSICSSPSARNVPLPPIEWLNQLQVPSSDERPSRPSSSISNTSASSSSTSLASSESSSIPSSPISRFHQSDKTSGSGIRVCPLQLIAAVASA